nr:RNA-directed DNA polymerase, eukaryota, reverse transcriptase zinc-binding domain protein [Tanacetum cinerariifolium]
FTPEVSQQEKYYTSSPIKEKCNDHGDKADRSLIVHPRVMNFSQESNVNESSSGASSIKCPRNTGKGGSILEVLDEMIRVGQSMGYDMDGCSKDIEHIIVYVGNSNYHFVSGDSARNYGGILCVWEDSMFKKDSVLVSDNFVVIFGTWLPNNTKVLIVTIYAPQSRVLKRTLWEYISLMNSRWHGESIVLGDLMKFGLKKKDSMAVKDAFRDHFASRFKKPFDSRLKLNIQFPNRLSSEQVEILDSGVSRAVIRDAVWGCGVNKSPGPDGFTFEFFRRYWNFLGTDFCEAIESFFVDGAFLKGNNASFITLIPKVMEAKFVTDFRPISLIGSVYKVVTKILANRLSMVISDLVSDSQSAFVANRQILDGPFILNEILAWCKKKKKQALIFKADFAKAYDSVGWDYLLDVLQAFGFGPNWCKWISGIFTSAMSSV